MAALRARVGTDARRRSSTRAGGEATGFAGGLARAVVLASMGFAACTPGSHGTRPWEGRAVDGELSVLTVPDAGTDDAGAAHAVTAFNAEPAFKLAPSNKNKSDAYPCSECHDADMETDAKPRKFDDDHADIVLHHGGGRFWCLECHDTENRDMLTRIGGAPVPFERADRVCAKCHFRQQRDFMHAAHGKRVERWRGERVLWPCVRCHDPHAPALAPRAPMPGPGVPGALGRGARQDPP